ncbi:MAG: four helix bundle protein [Planctomycetales bacterium]|nr:four helix bundle protein [Planctomycetales bacterium]
MTEPIFDHDRFDVYRLSIDYVASSFAIAKNLGGCHRHARDQWPRAAQSIPLNIAEGNGKRSLKVGVVFWTSLVVRPWNVLQFKTCSLRPKGLTNGLTMS